MCKKYTYNKCVRIDNMDVRNKMYKGQGIHVITALFTVEQGITKVLLIKRKNKPFEGDWVLTGGALYNNEDLETGALRELEEKTGITGVSIKQFKAFGNEVESDITSNNLNDLVLILDDKVNTDETDIAISKNSIAINCNKNIPQKFSLNLAISSLTVAIFLVA